MGWQVHGTDIREWDGPPPDRLRGPGGRELTKLDGHITRDARPRRCSCWWPTATRSRSRTASGWRCSTAAGGRWRAGSSRRRSSASSARRPPRSARASAAAATRWARRCSRRSRTCEGAADGRMLDLRTVISAQLAAGGRDATSQHLDRCTSCEPDLYFSHRRDDGVTGRQAGVSRARC